MSEPQLIVNTTLKKFATFTLTLTLLISQITFQIIKSTTEHLTNQTHKVLNMKDNYIHILINLPD